MDLRVSPDDRRIVVNEADCERGDQGASASATSAAEIQPFRETSTGVGGASAMTCHGEMSVQWTIRRPRLHVARE
jgi:hypothetical protein